MSILCYLIGKISSVLEAFNMKGLAVPRSVDNFLSSKLSGSVFHWRMIGVLLLPIILDSLFSNLISLFASAMVSQNGEASVAAVSLVTPVCGVITNIAGCIICGGGVVIAQCFGRGDPKRLNASIGMTFWIPLAACIAVVLPMILFPKQLLMLLYPKAETIVLEKASVYLTWNALSNIPYAIVVSSLTIFRSTGQTGVAMVTNITCNLSHLIFSIIFLNIMKLDIWGCSIALFLARLLAGGLGAFLLFARKHSVKLKLRDMFVFDIELFRSTMMTSIPFTVDMIIGSVCGIVLSAYMIPLGTTALAANSIANQMMVMLYSVPYATVTLAQILVGRCLGAGRQEEAYTYGNRCVQLYMIIQALTAIIFFMLLPPLLQLFQTSDTVSDTTTKLLLWSLPALIVPFAACNVYTETIRSAGDSNYITIVSSAVLLLFNTGLGYILAIVVEMGLLGVWVAMWCGWLFRGGLLWWRFRSRAWLRHNLLK